MISKNKDFLAFSIYNFSRYIFLKIEYDYELYLDDFNITLPQLRCLWIIKCFPNISVSKISQIGCWSVPTVTNMLKLIEEKGYINKHKRNNKEFSIVVSKDGEKIISKTKLNESSLVSLLNLNKFLLEDEIEFIIDFYTHLLGKHEKDILLDYINLLNKYSLKIDFKAYNKEDKIFMEKIIKFYNLLRVFVLSIQKEHSLYLKDLGITYPQIRALKLIESFPNINSFELSKIGFWSHSTANLISKNLYSKGLIVKTRGNNKNNIQLSITGKGEEIIKEDIKNNVSKISYIKTLTKSNYQDLIRANSILNKISKKLNIDIIEDIIRKTYLLNSLH